LIVLHRFPLLGVETLELGGGVAGKADVAHDAALYRIVTARGKRGGVVECVPMETVGAPVAPRVSLPRVGDYLQSVWDLGRRSIRPALPALTFLYFYRVGVGAYLAVANRTFSVQNATDVDILPGLAVAASVLPLFLLVYTPMLPLQEGLLEGRPIPFLAAARRALESAWSLTLSGLVQGVALFVPFLIVCIGAALMIPLGSGATSGLGSVLGAGSELNTARLLGVVIAAILGVVGMLVVGVLLMFATPAVVLDGQGPIQSIASSVRLVLSHLGAVLSRVLAFAFLSFVILILLTLPTGILEQVSEISGGVSLPVKIASVIWSSAVAVLFFPFGIASLTVLYRALVPAAGGTHGAPIALDEEYRPAAATTAPFE